MRLPSLVFGGGSFGRERRDARPAGKARRRRHATHRLGGEMLEGRAVMAVMVPAPTVTAVTDAGSVVLRTGGVTNAAPLTISGTVASGTSTVTVFNGNTSLGTATISGSGRTWSFTTSALTDGIYNFRARAAIGAVTSAASVRAFVVTVDTAAPAAPTISNVLDDRAPVIGTVPRGGSTNDRTLTLTGTAEPGSRVEVFAGSTSLGIATLVGSTWRFTTTPLTTNGGYSFTARATDKAGNTSVAAVLPYSVTVDTGEPTPSIDMIIDNVGNVPTDVKALQLSNDTTLVIQGTANAGSSVKIFDGRNTLGTTVANGGGVWTFATRPLTNGQTYRFTAQATDSAGNTSGESGQSPILIDTTPAWSVITGANDGSKAVADRGVTNKTRLTISGTSEPGSTVDLYDGTLLVKSGLPADPSGRWSFLITPLEEGLRTFTARATTDAAGNTNVLPSAAYTVTVDRTASAAPTILSAIDSLDPTRGPLPSGHVTRDTQPRFTGSTPELRSTVKIYDGTTFLGRAEMNGTFWTFRPQASLAEGRHTLNATATDRAGNESAVGSFTIDIDTTGPTFTGFGTLPTAGTYDLGTVVVIELAFDEPVYVDTTEGAPRIQLNIENPTKTPRYAIYDSGGGTDTLKFKYEPQLGDKTTGALDFNPPTIDPNDGTIRDAAGNDVKPSLTSLAAGRHIKVDAKLTMLDPLSSPNSNPLPKVTRHADGKTIADFATDDPSLPRLALSQITLTFNAPLTSGLTTRSFDLFLENRSMSTEDVVIEKLSDDKYRLTLPPSTHQSLSGYYRLVIGPISGREDMSLIKSGDVPMEDAVALHWYKPPSA